ncbi:RnfABCDGE type electron transport complex subunit G [Kiritimatiellaeota bacterium B1221]|nr:RnfABCDGE type electron transport complex subunit G [Kiritimatiellaeota bacterium B1221]
MSADHSSMKLVATLGGIAVFSGLLLSLTYEITKPMIAKNESEALEAAVFEVLPGAVTRENYLLDDVGLQKVGEGSSREANLYAGINEAGERVGFALSGEARGYADVVRVLYGYNPETQQVVGLRVLSSNETPGLGDRIEKDPAFQENFTALDASLAHEITTVKNGEKTEPWQIDGISGATVSSKAIGKALRDSTHEWVPQLHAALEGSLE